MNKERVNNYKKSKYIYMKYTILYSVTPKRNSTSSDILSFDLYSATMDIRYCTLYD